MYFGADVGGNVHLWRQRFPDGTAEQITFGTTHEEGLALAPDGRSLITSVGTRQGAIWIHDATGERPISSEGYASVPHMSRDGRGVFYLQQRDSMAWSAAPSGELRHVNLASGKTDNLLPGVSITDYDISRDEREVVYTSATSSGESEIWLASLDRRSAPRQITRSGDQVSFGANGELVFRLLENKENFLYRINRDGSGREPITGTPVLVKSGVSPDGEWVTASVPLSGGDNPASDAVVMRAETVAVPVHGGAFRKICSANCPAIWSSDGSLFYVVTAGRTLAIPVPAGKSLPDLPASGVNSAAEVVGLAGARVIEQRNLFPGPDVSTYAFQRTEQRSSLFRIPLH